MDLSTTTDGSAIAPAAAQVVHKAAASGGGVVKFEGMRLAVTDGNEVAEVLRGGALRVLASESFADDADEDGGKTATTRHHFVDVQGKREAMLLLVSVREDEHRIVDVRRFL
ncbi:hypothetical protein ACP70R_000407 [Stipagrostis hirtigluma subsp. patula]